MKKKYTALDVIAIIVVIIGALNWGVLGIINYNVIAAIIGDLNILTRIVYIIIGLCGLWVIYSFCRSSKSSATDSSS